MDPFMEQKLRQLMEYALLELQGRLLEAEYEYWTALTEFYEGKPEKLYRLYGIKQ